ncbi:MAG TPA: DUF4135 domain-containing protein, partial [Anaerolineae bacterium]|nr:DUF4135 domain-containing protein [Anaerolineae bacterium]
MLEVDTMFGNSWIQATWLAERLTGLSAENTPPPHSPSSAEKRLKRWQNNKAFPQPDLWQSFLKDNAISEELLQYLLTEPPALLAERLPDTPKWVQRFESAYRHSTTPTERPIPHKFTPFIAPLLHMARDTMQAWASIQQCTMLDSASMIDQLSQSLGRELIRLVNPTLVLELHAAQLQNRLDGNKSADTEQIFCNQLATPHFIRKIIREYPLLARILDAYVQDWLHARELFFQRLAADWEAMIAPLPAIKQSGRIIALDDQVSDPHCDGERVIIVSLASGEKVVYKPKTIAVDVHFQTLLGWINAAGFQPALRQITVLNRP